MNKENLIKYVLPCLTSIANTPKDFYNNNKLLFKLEEEKNYDKFRRVSWHPHDQEENDWRTRHIGISHYINLHSVSFMKRTAQYGASKTGLYESMKTCINYPDLRININHSGIIRDVSFNTTSKKCNELIRDALEKTPYFDFSKYKELLYNLESLQSSKKGEAIKREKKDKLKHINKLGILNKIAKAADPDSYVDERYINHFKLKVAGYEKSFEFKIRKTKPNDWVSIQKAVPGMITLIKAQLWSMKYK